MTAFAVCTGLGWWLLPGDSLAFWTSVMFRTERIGDLADSGNQSLRGILLRTGWPPSLQTAVWVGVAIAVSLVALRHGRTLYRDGAPVRAAALIGATMWRTGPPSS